MAITSCLLFPSQKGQLFPMAAGKGLKKPPQIFSSQAKLATDRKIIKATDEKGGK